MKKQSVPALATGNSAIDQFASAVKANIDDVTGQHKNSQVLMKLQLTATLTDVITAYNKVVDRLNSK